MPYTILGVLLANRTSWCVEEGINRQIFRRTWSDYRRVDRTLKPIAALVKFYV